MKSSVFILPPASVKVILILFEARRIYKSEIWCIGNGIASAAGVVPRCRFTDIVEACPYKLTWVPVVYNGLVPACRCRVAPRNIGVIIRHEFICGVAELAALLVGAAVIVYTSACNCGNRFGSEERLWKLSCPWINVIVRTNYVNIIVNRPCGTVVVALSKGTCCVVCENCIADIRSVFCVCCRNRRNRSACAFGKLVAYIPHEYAGVIAVTKNGFFCYECCPCEVCWSTHKVVWLSEAYIEVFAEVVGVAVFGILPSVEYFLKNKKTQFVADLNKNLWSGVVRCSYGVDAHLFHYGHLTIEWVVFLHRTESALIVVHTYALKLHLFAVEREARWRTPLDCSYAECCLVCVENIAVCIGDCCNLRIEIGCIRAPKLRIRHRLTECKVGIFTGRQLSVCAVGCYDIAGRVFYLGFNLNRCGILVCIFDIELCGDCRRGARNRGCRNLSAVVRYVYLIENCHRDITCDTRTRIPAAWFHFTDNLNGYAVPCVAVTDNIITEVYREWIVAVVVLSHKFTVNIDVCVVVYAVECEPYVTLFILRRNGEHLSVPACAGGKVARFRLGVCRCEALSYTEVMGQVNRLPWTVFIALFLRARGVGKAELPIVVEIKLFSCDDFVCWWAVWSVSRHCRKGGPIKTYSAEHHYKAQQ